MVDEKCYDMHVFTRKDQMNKKYFLKMMVGPELESAEVLSTINFLLLVAGLLRP